MGPGQEMTFNYQSQVLTGIPEISQSHWSGIKVNAKVIVQTFSDYSLRMRVAEPEFWTVNGQNVRLSETGRVMRDQESESVKVESLTKEFKRFLMEPFLVHMKAGVVESVIVGKNEPASVTNIKKSILSQIQLDIAGTRRSHLETNHITGCPGYDCVSKAESTIAGCPGYDCVSTVSKFKTKEASVQGECLTQYSVQKLPQWKINQLEEAWRLED